MTPGVLYEPDKAWSALQAGLFLCAMILPLALSVNFRTVVSATPITVSITAAPTPPKQESSANVAAVREQVEAVKRNLEQAEVARRRQQQEVAEQKKEEARKRAEEARRERERIDAERRAEAQEQKRIAEELEQKKLEEEQKKQLEEQKQLEEEQKKKLAEQKRIADLEAKKLAEEEAKLAREEQVRAKQLADRNSRIMARLINAIHDRVQRHISSPDNIPFDIQVEIRVPLQNNGRLATTPEVIRSSGFPNFDEQAVRAIIKGAEQGFELPEDPDLRKQFDELILIIKPLQN